MSTDIKYQVMAELLDIHPAAWEKAEVQASKIIGIVKGGCSCSIPCGEETLGKLDKLFPSDPEENFTASVKVRSPESRPKHHPIPTEESKANILTVEEELSKMQIGWAAKRKLTGKLPSDANEIIASMKASGMTHAEIGEKLGISKTTSKNRLVKWRKAQKASELYEPGAVEAAAEAKAAEATIRKYRTVEDLVKSMDRPGTFDSEIMAAVNRAFPGNELTVDDIACMRWKA